MTQDRGAAQRGARQLESANAVRAYQRNLHQTGKEERCENLLLLQ